MRSRSASVKSWPSTATSLSITIWCSTCARRTEHSLDDQAEGGPQGRLFSFVVFLMLVRRASGSSGLCAGQHLGGMGQGFVGQVDAAEHARHFLDALLLVQVGDGGAGVRTTALLVHEQVMVALGGDLGQVSHAQYLAALAQTA